MKKLLLAGTAVLLMATSASKEPASTLLRRPDQRGGGLYDAADHDAIGKHVEVVSTSKSSSFTRRMGEKLRRA